MAQRPPERGAAEEAHDAPLSERRPGAAGSREAAAAMALAVAAGCRDGGMARVVVGAAAAAAAVAAEDAAGLRPEVAPPSPGGKGEARLGRYSPLL